MNIDELPPELLVKIFSHLSQDDLFTVIDKVCVNWREQLLHEPSLWRKINFPYHIWIDFSKYTKQFTNIASHIQELTIAEHRLQQVLNYGGNMMFSNLKVIHVSLDTYDFCNEIVKRCPVIETVGLSIQDALRVDIEKCLKIFESIMLKGLLIEYRGEREKFNRAMTSFLRKQPALQELVVTTEKIFADNVFKDLFKLCPEITKFHCGEDCISNSVFTDSVEPLDITDLSVTGAFDFNDDGLSSATSRSRNLTSLDITGCTNISNDGFRYISENCKSLKKLTFGSKFMDFRPLAIASESLSVIAAGCQLLESLSVRQCSIDALGVTRIAQCCRNIKVIDFHLCPMISDTSLFAIADNCIHLVTASFTLADGITIKGVIAPILSCPKMYRLRFGFCNNITYLPDNAEEFAPNEPDQERGVIRRYFEKVNTINRDGIDVNLSHLKILQLPCPNITTRTILQLAVLCPELERLDTGRCRLNFNPEEKEKLMSSCRLLSYEED
ncbi:F-box/LRR-repeat protein 17-like [Mytilus trossulus]|uniref:F-box/LRR-repeat protein 17-like n=1 Tax=Mytilus trossulus TaxID=6551 RepID=UPI0030044429